MVVFGTLNGSQLGIFCRRVAQLIDVAHVVLFDLRGCGRSHRTPPRGDLADSQLQPDLLADDAAALIRDSGSPAYVLGFSFGGRIAMRVVQQHPQVVRRLVLASTTAYTDFDDELSASADYRQRSASCVDVGFDDPVLSRPDAADGASESPGGGAATDDGGGMTTSPETSSTHAKRYRAGWARR